MNSGVITKSTGKYYHIKSLANEVLIGTIRGRFKLEGLKLTNPVAVGDRVEYQINKDGTALITKIQPRNNYVIRQSPRKKHFLHLIASNVDQALLIVTIIEPNLKQGFIDRFLLMTEPYDIPVCIIFNKSDLYQDAENRLYNYLREIYERLGYKVMTTSAVNQDGLPQLKKYLTDKVTLIAGQSGVGKSSIVNAIEPNLDLKTTFISNYTGKGQHTTTFAEMFELSTGGQIIDTPGIKTLSYNHFEVMDVAHNFREFFEFSENCKYGDCTHREEPQCAVKIALEKELISELRYANYLQILEDIENQNYWERIKDY